MPTIRSVERSIKGVEGFAVAILHPDGRDVRSDREHVPSYPFQRAAASTMTVRGWIDTRFRDRYAGFKVVVLDGHGKSVHGGTRLSNVRASYG